MKPIGIVGGAGPLAGAFLLERLLRLCTSLYGCYKDADFPKVVLLSYPFSDMLSANRNDLQVKEELRSCLQELRGNGAAVLAIACNTLHAFLDEEEEDLVHLPRTTAEQIKRGEKPLLLCTSTSAQCGLHSRFFPCEYPDPKTQACVDWMIDLILKGADAKAPLAELIQEQMASTIVLGCTELSLYAGQLTSLGKEIIDPLEILARKILEKSRS